MILRLLGLLLLAAGAWVWWSDWSAAADGPMRLTELGELWFTLHKESLIGLQSGLENRVSPDAFRIIEPILYEPAAYVLGGLGAVLLALGLASRAAFGGRGARA